MSQRQTRPRESIRQMCTEMASCGVLQTTFSMLGCAVVEQVTKIWKLALALRRHLGNALAL